MAESKIILGGQNKVAKLFPLYDKKKPVLVWAEDGLVHWEDTNTGEEGHMVWREAADRVIALSEMVFKSHESGFYSAETRRTQQYISDMEAILRQAKEQSAQFKPEEFRRPVRKMRPVERECW